VLFLALPLSSRKLLVPEEHRHVQSYVNVCSTAPASLQVHVRVKIPQKVGSEEKKLVEQLKDLQGSKEKVGGRGWF